ncbi:MAG: TRAP transporter small permease [Deltaproteobacteria bacterium]|nr:TRAP transporter small permease [Deltaproteobacteria bacterium]
METWQQLIRGMVGLLKRLGGAALVGMMALTCVDVIMRGVNFPLFGAVEIVSLLATVVLACAMPLTHLEHGHVGVDMLVRKFPPRVQLLVDCFTGVLSAAIFGLVCWQMFLYAGTLRRSGEVSMSVGLPSYLIVYVVAVAFGALFLVILTELVDNLRKVVRS